MRSHNNSRYQPKRTNYVGDYASYLFDARNAHKIQREQQQKLLRRIKRVSRVAIIASKNDLTSQNRRLQLKIRQFQGHMRTIYQNQYRIAAACLVVLTGLSVAVPPFLQATDTRPISLDAATAKLVGETRDDTAKYLQYSTIDKTYSFKPAKQENADYQHTGRNSDAYNTTFSQDASNGITVTDTKTNIDVTLLPDFFTANARKSTGNHIVYKSGRTELIYSLKYNGLKEDIVIPSSKGPTAQYSFTLRLPSGVEARLDEQGNIGIYSSDVSLFGDVSYGSDDDRLKVQKARENGQKTNLVMTIPYPIVKDATGQEYSSLASFTLGKATKKKAKAPANLPAGATEGPTTSYEYPITISAHGLANLNYPISLDPTIRVAGTSNFDNLQDEGGTQIDYTNTLIKRGSMTGGVLNTWTTNTSHLPYSGSSANIDIANGYVYATSGGGTVYSALIDSTSGAVETFTSTGVVPIAGAGDAVIYNGYMYMYGSTQWQYAKILPNGKLGSFTATTVHSQSRSNYSITASNGYIYLAGGYFQSGCPLTCTDNYLNTVQYAKQNADGSLGTWASTSSFTTGRNNLQVEAYNDYLYVIGGWDGVNGNTTAFKTVQYSKQNANGTLGTWINTTVLTTGRVTPGCIFMNGYLYVIAGFDNIATVEYAQVNSNGSLGTWNATTSINGTGRGGADAHIYNGKIYIGGGLSNSGSVLYDEIQYTTPRLAGESTTVTASGDFDTSGRMNPASLAYNGFLYITGGSTDNGTTFSSVIRRATIGSDGSLSSWTTSANTFSKARYQHGAVMYNGFMYIYGGYGNCGLFGALDYCNDVQYASIDGAGNLSAFTTSGNNMLVGRAAFSGVMYNGYLYVIGGRTSGGRQSDIDYAQIAFDNSVGSWQNNPTSLSRVQELHAITAYNGFMYLSGGFDGTTIFRDIQYAAISSSNGQIGSWTMINPGDIGGWGSDKYGHALWAYNGYLYQAGGCGANDTNTPCTNGTNDLQYRKIQSDGTIAAGSWSLSDKSISNDFEINIGWAVNGDTVYFMGGRTDVSTIHKDLNRIKLNNGGSGDMTTWTASGSSLSSARGDFSTAVSDGFIYIIGGASNSGNLSEILYTSISSAGVLGSWQTSATTGRNLPFTRIGHTSAVHNGYLYVFEGLTSDTERTRYAKLLSSGGIASDAGCGSVWCSTSAASTARSYGPSAYWNGYVYLSGSCNSSYCTNVDYAKLLDTGGVASDSGCGSSWCATTPLTRGRSFHDMAAYAGTMYVVGGFTNTATPNFINTVEFTSIGTNGSLGAWVATANLPRQERNASMVISNGYMYIIGGQYGTLGSGTAGTGVVRDTMFAPILKAGGVGTWKFTASTYTQARAPGGTTVMGGYVIVFGGDNAATTKTYYNNVDVTVPQSISHEAQFSTLYDFNLGVKPTKLITRGTKQNGAVVELNYSSTNNMLTTLDNSQTVTDIGYSGANATSMALGTNRTLSRYLYLHYTFVDSQSAVFPDTGNESTITDFDMYYISNPGSRLRGGRTFTNGVDRGLDAQPQ